MQRTLRLLLGVLVVFLFLPFARAQRDLNDLRTWVRFEVVPGVNLNGPYRGTPRFRIGSGQQRVMTHPRIELQIVRGTTVEDRIALPKLPAYFDWDTTGLANDRYKLRLVAIDERTQAETPMDEVEGRVDNHDDSETSSVTEPGTKNRDVSGNAPSPRFARRPSDTVISGLFSLPIIEWPEGTPARYMPVVDIYRDDKRVDSQSAGSHRPFSLKWDTTPTANGVYTLKLTVLNLADGTDTTADEITVTVQNEKLPEVKPDSPRPELRGALSSRSGISLPRGSRTELFKWVMLASKACGDPFPQVAAAQWALESSWGKSTSGQNNYFGIKAAPDQPGTEKVTNEWGSDGIYATFARFADYESPTDGIAARLKFLKKTRYSGYWTASSADAAARALQRGGYATDPSYASQLISIMRRMGY